MSAGWLGLLFQCATPDADCVKLAAGDSTVVLRDQIYGMTDSTA